MKAYGAADLQIHVFFIWASAALPPGEVLQVPAGGGWVGGCRNRFQQRGEEKNLVRSGSRTPTLRSSSAQGGALPTAPSRIFHKHVNTSRLMPVLHVAWFLQLWDPLPKRQGTPGEIANVAAEIVITISLYCNGVRISTGLAYLNIAPIINDEMKLF
jgi:hypothetical protein